MDHLSPHTSCRWPCSRRSDCRGGVRMSLCRIMRSRLPDDSCSAFQASAPGGQAEVGVSLSWPRGAGASGSSPAMGPGHLTDACRVALQHGQLLPCGRVPDLHKALVCAHRHQVPLGVKARAEHQRQVWPGDCARLGLGHARLSPHQGSGMVSLKTLECMSPQKLKPPQHILGWRARPTHATPVFVRVQPRLRVCGPTHRDISHRGKEKLQTPSSRFHTCPGAGQHVWLSATDFEPHENLSGWREGECTRWTQRVVTSTRGSPGQLWAGGTDPPHDMLQSCCWDVFIIVENGTKAHSTLTGNWSSRGASPRWAGPMEGTGALLPHGSCHPF